MNMLGKHREVNWEILAKTIQQATERGKEMRQPSAGTWEVAMKRSALLLESQRESGETRDGNDIRRLKNFHN